METYDKDALIRVLADAVQKVAHASTLPKPLPKPSRRIGGGSYDNPVYVRAQREAFEAVSIASEWLERAPAEIQAMIGMERSGVPVPDGSGDLYTVSEQSQRPK